MMFLFGLWQGGTGDDLLFVCVCVCVLKYSSIPGNRNWQIETADWNLDVRLDI